MKNEVKVRRKRVNWWKIMNKIGVPSMLLDFKDRQSKLYRGKHLSFNRCAYYVLKSYYSTTSQSELLMKLGEL